MLRAILCQLRSKRSPTRAFRKTTLTASLVSPMALYSTALFSPSSRIETCKQTEVILLRKYKAFSFSWFLSITTDTPKSGMVQHVVRSPSNSRQQTFEGDMDGEPTSVLVNKTEQGTGLGADPWPLKAFSCQYNPWHGFSTCHLDASQAMLGNGWVVAHQGHLPKAEPVLDPSLLCTPPLLPSRLCAL